MDTLQRDLLGDFEGYGSLVRYYRGTGVILDGDDTSRAAALSQSESETFVQGLYAEVISRPFPHLYRFFDVLPWEKTPDEYRRLGGDAGFATRMRSRLGGPWWSPRLPGIPQESRRTLAISHDFGRMDWIADISLAAGEHIYVGRAASQSDAFRGPWARLAGGGIQLNLKRVNGPAITLNKIIQVS